ncbi:MAG: hypothetical protein ACKVS8_05905 [Phycisphaerales bacterium]
MNRLTLRVRWTVGALAAAVVAATGGCASPSKPPTASIGSQLQPGSTIAVADAFGARVFSSPKSIAARKASTASYAAARE